MDVQTMDVTAHLKQKGFVWNAIINKQNKTKKQRQR